MKKTTLKSMLFGSLFTLAITSVLACTEPPLTNPTMTNERPDLSNRPSAVAIPSNAGSRDPIIATEREAPVPSQAASTGVTPQSAGVVQPAGAGAVVLPNSTRGPLPSNEPRSDAAVAAVNCLDATRKEFGSRTVPQNNNCPPSSRSEVDDSPDEKMLEAGR